MFNNSFKLVTESTSNGRSYKHIHICCYTATQDQLTINIASSTQLSIEQSPRLRLATNLLQNLYPASTVSDAKDNTVAHAHKMFSICSHQFDRMRKVSTV